MILDRKSLESMTNIKLVSMTTPWLIEFWDLGETSRWLEISIMLRSSIMIFLETCLERHNIVCSSSVFVSRHLEYLSISVTVLSFYRHLSVVWMFLLHVKCIVSVEYADKMIIVLLRCTYVTSANQIFRVSIKKN